MSFSSILSCKMKRFNRKIRIIEIICDCIIRFFREKILPNRKIPCYNANNQINEHSYNRRDMACKFLPDDRKTSDYE